MIITEITTALLLASAPAQSTGVPPADPSKVDAPGMISKGDWGIELPDLDAQTTETSPPSEIPRASPLPGNSDPPEQTKEPVSSMLEMRDIPPSSLGTDPGEVPPDENEIIVTGRTRTPGDPLQNINAESYAVTQAIDDAVVEPSAHAYEKAVPEPFRNGLRNFANNLHEPAVFVNFLLQLKPGKAAETAGRFLVNSTAGVAGLFDFAKRKPINLPRRRNGFANTLGCYGVKPGPFLFLPVIGATTVRDLIGGSIDALAIPTPLPNSVGSTLSKPYVKIPASIARELDKRVEFDEELEVIHNSNDPYVAAREYYLQKRQAQIDGICKKKDHSAM